MKTAVKILQALFGGMFILATTFTNAATLNQVQVTKFSDYTRAVFSISSNATTHVFTLDHPYRVVMDIDHTGLRTNLKKIPLINTGISQIRSGERPHGTLRVVFNVDAAPAIRKAVTVDNETHQTKLTVDIFAADHTRTIESGIVTPKPKQEIQKVVKPIKVTSKVEMTKKQITTTVEITKPREVPKELPKIIREPQKPVAATEKPVTEIKTVTLVKTIPTPTPVTATLSNAPKPQIQMSVVKRPTVVVIDAGHGGKDPGTVGMGGTREKNVVLAIALQLSRLINKEPNMYAVLTRNGDYFVSLRDRLDVAHKEKGDLFIAIHADSYFNNVQTGASVYAVSRHGATTEAAQWLAKHENYSELGGVDLGELSDQSPVLRSVLIDLAQTATVNDSLKLGDDVLGALHRVTSLHYPHVEQAPFVVLKSPDIPSILIETGFLSTPREEERLRTKHYRNKIAKAILNGLHNYLLMHPTVASNHVQTTVAIA